ncbi:hypothetical protein C5167_006438, partial [Papaver somniferum]
GRQRDILRRFLDSIVCSSDFGLRLKIITSMSKRQLNALTDKIINPISRTPFGRRRTLYNKIVREK